MSSSKPADLAKQKGLTKRGTFVETAPAAEKPARALSKLDGALAPQNM